MPKILPFKTVENKHDVSTDKDGMKTFSESSKEHTIEKKIILEGKK